VKTWTSILAAIAILAVAAQAGYSANGNIPADSRSGQSRIVQQIPSVKLAKAVSKSKAQAARIKALLAKNKALAARIAALEAGNRTTPSLPLINPVPPVDDSCGSYMLCTPEEDCLIWGNNCNLVSQPATTATDQASTQPPASEPAAANTSQDTVQGAASQNGGLECASLVDPATSLALPENYDWTC
jgi:hypothetical protein